MRLNIVNAQEKHIVYSIKDTSPEFNLPALKDDEALVLGDSLHNLKIYNHDAVAELCKENGFVYSLYMREFEFEFHMTYEEQLSASDYYQDYALSTLIDYLSGVNLLKVGSSNLEFDNWHRLDFPEGVVDGSLKLLDDVIMDNYYMKQEANHLTIDKLHLFNEQICSLTSFVLSTFSQDDLSVFPELIPVSSIDDIQVPVIGDLGSQPIFPQVELTARIDPPTALLANESGWLQRLDEMESKLPEIAEARNLRSCAKVRFRTWDAFYNKYDVIASATIDNHQVELKSKAELSHQVQSIDEICPNIYTMRLYKPGYDTVKLKLRTEINYPANVETLDIGTINLLKSWPRPFKLWFEWGFFPEDLDVHIYSFNTRMLEHCFFMNKKTRTIDLDRDDIDAWRT